jgi:hypothetical protein
MRGSEYDLATSTVESVEASSLTTSSKSSHVWASADSIASPIHWAALYAGIQIETKGWATGGRVPH